jgi:hypothetical protein
MVPMSQKKILEIEKRNFGAKNDRKSTVVVGSEPTVSMPATLASYNLAKRKPFDPILLSLDRAIQALLNSG